MSGSVGPTWKRGKKQWSSSVSETAPSIILQFLDFLLIICCILCHRPLLFKCHASLRPLCKLALASRYEAALQELKAAFRSRRGVWTCFVIHRFRLGRVCSLKLFYREQQYHTGTKMTCLCSYWLIFFGTLKFLYKHKWVKHILTDFFFF